MKLNEIKDNSGATHYKKIVGRGIGSGLGKTSGKGHKGQKARGTGKVRLGFEGGQNPIYRRMPKRGFTNIFKNNFYVLNLNVLNDMIKNGKIDAKTTISCDYLKDLKLIKGSYDGIKVLSKGDITYSLNLEVHGVSKVALEKLTKAGGKVSIIEDKKFINKKKTFV
jgi:large subunit ribosomal protein L15